MEKFKVVFDLPKLTIYYIDADYPEAAKRKAAKLHKKLMPKLGTWEIERLAHCFRVNPKSSGRRYKEPSFIEEMYKRYYGES